MKNVIRLLLVLMISFGLVGVSMAAKGGKGQGAGGVRTDHVSETGMEKGKAWAGEKEKNEKDEKDEKEKKEKNEKKENNEKKEKKEKKGKKK